jgi:hypothetical protein
MDTINFDLRLLQSHSMEEMSVEVLDSPVGAHATRSVRLNPTLLSYQNVFSSSHNAAQYGRYLMETVFSHEVAVNWRQTLQFARQNNKTVLFRLFIRGKMLDFLPWELLYDNEVKNHLALEPNINLIRCEAVGSVGKQSTLEGTDEHDPEWENIAASYRPAPLNRIIILQVDAPAFEKLNQRFHIMPFGKNETLLDNLGRYITQGSSSIPKHLYVDLAQSCFTSRVRQSIRLTEFSTLLQNQGAEIAFFVQSFTSQLLQSSTLPIAHDSVLSSFPASIGLQYGGLRVQLLSRFIDILQSYSSKADMNIAFCDARRTIAQLQPGSLDWAAPVLFRREYSSEAYELGSEELLTDGSIDLSYCKPVIELYDSKDPKFLLFASFSDNLPSQKLKVGETYNFTVNIFQSLPGYFEWSTLATEEDFTFDITISAPHMFIGSSWHNTCTIKKDASWGRADFRLTAAETGRHAILVDVYYRHHWSQTVRIYVDVEQPNK